MIKTRRPFVEGISQLFLTLGNVAVSDIVMVLPSEPFADGLQFLAPRLVEEALAALNPQGRYMEIPRSGHVPPLENPTAFNAALDDFLGE